MLKVYLDTSILSVAEFDDLGERKAVTLELLDRLARHDGMEAYVSRVVLAEILRTRDEGRRGQILARLERHSPGMLPGAESDQTVMAFAERYLAAGCVPPNKLEDALHVAISVVYGMDILATWIYRHLAGVERELAFAGVHADDEAHPFRLRMPTPWELAK